MLRALGLAMTILVLPLGTARADAPPDLGANSALKYWQAFATLPKLSDAEGQKLIAECLTMPLDAQARELVAKADYSLRMLHYGVALPRCDWGVPAEEGIYARLPHGPAARVLSSLACLRARMRFEEGRNAEAVDDLVAALALARQVTRAGTYVMLLVGYSLEHRTGEALALYLPKLDAGTLKGLPARLAALPPGLNAATALATEEHFYLDWLVRGVKGAKDEESLLTVLAFTGLEPEGKGRDSREEVRAFLKACGGTPQGVLKFAEGTRASYARMASKWDLPPDQFEKELQREEKRQAGNPVFKVFFPALVNVRRAQARADVRRALLSAALAVRLDGRDALKEHPDPVAGGPFEYVPFEGGFELHSKVKQQDGKPVVLTVGRRGK